MNHKELITFDKVFQYYLNDNDHDEEARDFYIETMKSNVDYIRIWNDIFDIPVLKDINDMMNRMS